MNVPRAGLAGVALLASATFGAGATAVSTRDTVAKVRTDLRTLTTRVDVLEGKTPPSTTPPTTTPTPTTQPTPGNVCAVDPPNGEVAITAAIRSCPDGTTVRFPAQRQYTQAHRILVTDRRDLTIDGNGSTFTNSSNGRVTHAIDGNFVFLRGVNVTLRNVHLIGDFTAFEGQKRSLATIGNLPEITEGAMGVGLYGTDGALIEDVEIDNQWGDGVTTGPDEYLDGSTRDYTNNLTLRRVQIDTVGRHCVAPTSGTNVLVEDSRCSDAWYGGIDAELDGVDQPLKNHRYLRNTFDGFNHFGILVPVAGRGTGDIEIRDNVFLSANDVPQYDVIGIGIYPGNPHTFANVTITGNTVPFYCSAIQADHVAGGAIVGNTLQRRAHPSGTPEAICFSSEPVKVTTSTGVTVAGNR